MKPISELTYFIEDNTIHTVHKDKYLTIKCAVAFNRHGNYSVLKSTNNGITKEYFVLNNITWDNKNDPYYFIKTHTIDFKDFTWKVINPWIIFPQFCRHNIGVIKMARKEIGERIKNGKNIRTELRWVIKCDIFMAKVNQNGMA